MSEPVAEPAGVLLVDKPQGITSHDVVDSVRRLYRTRRVGHAGTLDPMATGLLIMLVGKATKASDQLMAQDKEYLGEATLGIVTDTQDAEGETLETNPVPEISEAQVRVALASMLGDQSQIPPMHSAKKIGGQKLYDLARKGIEVVREPRAISISEFELLSWQSPKINFRVRCTKGTYVRTLAYDLGRKLGPGAHLSMLRRTRSGQLDLSRGHTLPQLGAMNDEQLVAALVPVSEAAPAAGAPPSISPSEPSTACTSAIAPCCIPPAKPPGRTEGSSACSPTTRTRARCCARNRPSR
jgi:tRNA pseudouridine55 synthase